MGETWPSPHSWRRSRRVSAIARLLYTSGITREGGGCTMAGADPHGGTIYHLPRWGSVLPRRRGRMRPYLLFRQSWWWECHRRQGFRIRGRHQPEEPFALGICAACLPCPYCGAHRRCEATCWAITGDGPDPLHPRTAASSGPAEDAERDEPA